jgi:asparagine synthase (glutamine-hydrolysing)
MEVHRAEAKSPVNRVLDLVAEHRRSPRELTGREVEALLFGDPARLTDLEGSFALVARRGIEVRLARSLDRPMRYFLAKEGAGPYLIVAERIDEIRGCLEREGHAWQFHPTYTRMVPAHHVTRIELVGCPDPSPSHLRFFSPAKDVLPADRREIGRRYVRALYEEVRSWIARLPPRAPIGVAFSGGADSGAVLLCAYRALLESGQSAARLKAFTLAVDGGGDDLAQARAFLGSAGLDYLGETIDVPAAAIDPFHAVEVIEDYKPLDVECAAVNLALLRALRDRYPDWVYLLDGDGGDENLKDYPIEENRELTIRSVVTNRLLYHEGWGVEALKHSLTYSGGLSRGYVRTCGPARRFGFVGFSPFTRPRVIEVAEGIPYAELCRGEVETLYRLKGEVVAAGVREVLGIEMPIFPKRRFQHGAASIAAFTERLGVDPDSYRRHFLSLHTSGVSAAV